MEGLKGVVMTDFRDCLVKVENIFEFRKKLKLSYLYIRLSCIHHRLEQIQRRLFGILERFCSSRQMFDIGS